MSIFYIAVAGVTGLVGWWLFRSVRRRQRRALLHSKIEKRRAEREAHLAAIEEKADERWSRITDLNFTELAEALQNESIRAVEALTAYQLKAAVAHRETNAVADFIPEAESWAAALDEQYRNQPKPPLFGLPFSVKEAFAIRGHDVTRGYAQFLGRLESADAVTVAALKELGAIPFVRTNVPQTLLSFGCSNPVYGLTKNPEKASRTPGGSSGGETALIALGGAPFGMGGDVGGSIRIPAHFCGLVGFKPSHLRLSQIGSAGSVPGRPMICASVGPIAREVDTITTVMKELLKPVTFAKDPYVAPLSFRESLFTGIAADGHPRPLRIGYYDYDGWMEVTPAVKRAVREAKEALEKCGQTLIPWTPPDVPLGFRLFLGSVTVDSGRYLLDLLSRDLLDPSLRFSVLLFKIPGTVKRVLGTLLKPFSPKLASMLQCFPLTTSELRSIYEQLVEYRRTFVASWMEHNLDCVLCPPHVSPALPHEYPSKVLPTVSYTAIYNALDFCAGVVPVTRVREEDEEETRATYPTESQFPFTGIIRSANVAGSLGLPVGVQCVSLPFQEEVCLRMMKLVQSHR